MKKTRLIIISVVILLASSQLFAQRGGGQREFNVNDRLEKLDEVLDLSTDQEMNIKEILEEKKIEIEEMRKNRSGDREEKQSQMREMNKKYTDKINALLTDDQKIKYKTHLEEQRENRRQRGKN